MIIHTYLTNGMLDWGKLFLESFKYHHGEEYKIVMDTRDLNDKQIKQLKKIYGNLQVKNKKLDYNKIAKRAKETKDNILRYKKKVENDKIKKENKVWKLYISIEDRYRNTIWEAMEENQDEDFLIHIDIDMYIRQRLDSLFDIVRNHDISIRFRDKPHKEVNVNRKVLGNIIGFRVCQETFDFLRTWIHYIDDVPLHEKPKGYGQISFYYAYLEHKHLNWGNIPSIAKPKADNALIWSGNKGSNWKQLQICREEFDSLC